ncbi:UDP-N-acetylmuramoylalanine/D-glutamate ligase [Dethiosulfovibrio peptidovorans DSM 11002]|uniref:UDP-N-acetylmuramoylalanine--D-glutamate ligase n=1 Tax=Dethiosulfovibrio peptidovorans DSM 11002 TaxID=469381 RepID=D2Z3A7_9BACT|nr:UDP-N-acetylmuramoyl-L-alanine--D-glutamate ligase [Dethiosulfovibrio peptidovorans]EFC92147.1 UDP-N-acetylmuramoylalanine/D-glutamate ligase [Dethiosulfovibrio peptidovorans DSM 11002]
MEDLFGKKVTVLGAGISGEALASSAVRSGASVFVTESKADIPEDRRLGLKDMGVNFEIGGHSSKALECDLMLVSSGVSPKAPLLLEARDAGIKVMGEVDFVLPKLDGKVVVVTGTNGKTTTTSLIAHLLEVSGLDALALGNIGSPLGDFAGERRDVFVIELSSFQLHWTEKSEFDISVITNIAPDHIDWHGSYENYISAKKKAISHRRDTGWSIVQEKDRSLLGGQSDPRTIGLTLENDLKKDGIFINNERAIAVIEGVRHDLFMSKQVPLLGGHNIENAAMAATACILSSSRKIDWSMGLASYQAPPHRCQFIVEKDGISYVDDSKGTNVASTCTALRSIPGGKVVILGGKGKGENYRELALAVKDNCRYAILLGEERFAIADALKEQNVTDWQMVESMEEAVVKASRRAKRGDTVLLSPACTSWDMYGSYRERGDHFSGLAKAIEGIDVKS